MLAQNLPMQITTNLFHSPSTSCSNCRLDSAELVPTQVTWPDIRMSQSALKTAHDRSVLDKDKEYRNDAVKSIWSTRAVTMEKGEACPSPCEKRIFEGLDDWWSHDKDLPVWDLKHVWRLDGQQTHPCPQEGVQSWPRLEGSGTWEKGPCNFILPKNTHNAVVIWINS